MATLCLPFAGLAQQGGASLGAGNLVERRAPTVADGAQSPSSDTDPAADATAANEEGDPKPLGVDLRGLQLVSKTSKPLLKGTRGALVVDPALHLPDGLVNELQSEFLGQPVSMALLNRLVKKINKSYQATDFPLVDAYLPEQDITSGNVQVMVREAVLGEVRVEGAKRSSPDYMIRQVRVQPGERIDTSIIAGDIRWLNENPIRNVSVIYERGSKEGASDLILKTKEINPFQVYAGYANSGLVATGLNEVSGGFNWYQMFGTEQSLAYQFSGNQELDKLRAHALVWGVPFPWRHRLQLIGVTADNAIQSVQTGGTLGVNGTSRQLTGAYTIPLHSAWSSVRHKVVVAADYKSTSSDILFGGQALTSNAAQVMQFRLGYEATVTDKLGFTRFSLAGVYSPGNLFSRNTYEAFDQLRAASQAKYWYAAAELDRLLRLPRDCSLLLHLGGQFSNRRLLPTEQILAGGYRTVRGYQEVSARGDSGIKASLEFNLPALHFAKWEGGQDSLNCFAFYDMAYLTSVGDYISEPDQNLHSAGVGLRYNVGDYVDLRLAYGWPLRSSGVVDVPKGRLHFGMNVKY
ncbi:MAG: ShlB/FhaC/HecB family hemolysin secretion/activation protein [Prosthecobacter sp.]